ncbi:MAG: FAD-dependent monooxygenase, partial [Acidobacteria bacterium]|nr:FAD-dependent monooxygenase [Acidobacteriota bacterium]
MRSSAESPSGWAGSHLFFQPGLERPLRAAAVRNGADVRLSTTVVSIEQTEHDVGLGLDDGSAVRAAWVVACDGARSTARRLLGVTMHDLQFEEPWLVLDLVLQPGTPEPSEVTLQVCDPKRPHTLVPMPAPRFRFEFMLLPGEDPAWIQQPEVIDRLLADWVDPATVEVERAAVYTFHGLVADQWRQGRVLLAGDAAHQMPPFLGQGMCSGMRDAANLAWKVDAVVHGADPALLDTYQAERAPHVRSIIESAVGFGRLICTTDPAATWPWCAPTAICWPSGPPVPRRRPCSGGAEAPTSEDGERPAAGGHHLAVVADHPRLQVHHPAARFHHRRVAHERPAQCRTEEAHLHLDRRRPLTGLERRHGRAAHRRIDQRKEHGTVHHAVRVHVVGADREASHGATHLDGLDLEADEVGERMGQLGRVAHPAIIARYAVAIGTTSGSVTSSSSRSAVQSANR